MGVIFLSRYSHGVLVYEMECVIVVVRVTQNKKRPPRFSGHDQGGASVRPSDVAPSRRRAAGR